MCALVYAVGPATWWYCVVPKQCLFRGHRHRFGTPCPCALPPLTCPGCLGSVERLRCCYWSTLAPITQHLDPLPCPLSLARGVRGVLSVVVEPQTLLLEHISAEHNTLTLCVGPSPISGCAGGAECGG